ncbi:MAG: NTPase [Candidatus Woesearchaeota archaeon]|nr:MAG: NTPase [Candidatus Woesearchaeota archaeon]
MKKTIKNKPKKINKSRQITINIGTKNPSKILAVKEAFLLYKEFKNAKFKYLNANSGVSEQPKSLREIIKGAKNRAINSFKDCNYSIGMESGIMSVPELNTGYMDLCICVIYDGKNFFYGAGPGFEFPKKVTEDIIKRNMNASESALKNKLTKSQYVGHDEGIVGILTRGIINRKEYHKYSVIMALIQVLNKKHYF